MLDRAFWREYLRRHPLDRPAALRQPFAGLAPVLAAPAEIFEALVRAAELERSGRRASLRLYLGDRAMVWRQTVEQLGAVYTELLPCARDGDLAGYAARLARSGHECFAVMLNESQRVLPELWFRVRGFVRELYAETGFALGGADANIFAGNYRRTPFGVHTDTRDVFTWIVEGEKTFLTWPDAPRDDDPGDRARAVVLRGRAGDLLYWPKTYWHVAEAERAEITSTLSIGIEHQIDGAAWIHDAMGAAAPEVAATHHPFDDAAIARSVQRLPPVLARALADHRARSADPRVDRQLRLRWLCWLTGYGILPPPEAEPVALADGDRVRGEPGYPIRCVPWRGALLCSANGHGFAAPRRAVVTRLVDALNSDREWRVDELCRSVSGRAPGSQARALLEVLLSFRAIVRTAAR